MDAGAGIESLKVMESDIVFVARVLVDCRCGKKGGLHSG